MPSRRLARNRRHSVTAAIPAPAIAQWMRSRVVQDERHGSSRRLPQELPFSIHVAQDFSPAHPLAKSCRSKDLRYTESETF